MGSKLCNNALKILGFFCFYQVTKYWRKWLLFKLGYNIGYSHWTTQYVATVLRGHLYSRSCTSARVEVTLWLASSYFSTLSVNDQRHYTRKLELLGNVEDLYLMWESQHYQFRLAWMAWIPKHIQFFNRNSKFVHPKRVWRLIRILMATKE